ncbi:aminodeoxychorismate synthase component I [Streptomyces sp. AN091965]|uniref:aminodeoxychorismate synthase component I n=1 Tax=Streptomyces sp. AN091965 TaxID=2927803 RepID=UPI001F616648|nr:aminodeoxychorismate synthase component I [Streptomyces sp. AN091965]MCI3927761.1 aminodeoxychorismate synthase component I [Streptomyces sp. AN091965]
MKTLLIDNYDSYTYNLFQLIAEVNGEEPDVVTNDAPGAADLDLSVYDNVVISPGPGHPGRAEDFGASARIIERATIPVLGVCLGHQGIAAAAGAVIARAPQARHGYLSRITHTAREVFADLPQDFTAVRYHSLAIAEPLPAALEATAWAEDGVIMAVRHRERPLWGVQFHPESVSTQYGHQMLANFRDLTLAHQGEHPETAPRPAAPRPAAATAPALAPKTAAPAAAPYQLHLRILEKEIDTETAFTHLYGAAQAPVFWLDSALAEAGRARFSFFGDAAGPLAETVRYRTGQGHVEVTRTGQAAEQVPGTVFDYLQDELRHRQTSAPHLPFDFTGGYVGYFGYELKGDLGATNKHRAPTPDAVWLFADRFIAVDHHEGTTYLAALSRTGQAAGPGGAEDAVRWLESTAAALLALPPRARTTAEPSTADVEPWLVHDADAYAARIADIHQQLRAGESYEVCLTNAAWAPAGADGLDFYRTLRHVNPAPYASYLRLGDDVEIAGSSPERFLTIDRTGTIETKPIKGTVPRGEDPSEDRRLRDSLTDSAKTRAENLMIVDLLRNDLGRVSKVGSVHVPRLMATESYRTVHQLVSTIRGTLREDTDAIDAVRACFPGGSMTGAPKRRTMEIIESLETEARGVYSGSIGWLSTNGTADLNIVIRTAVRIGDQWRIGAGGAIVLDSDAEDEYQEMLLKAAAPLRALHPATAAVQEARAAEVPATV